MKILRPVLAVLAICATLLCTNCHPRAEEAETPLYMAVFSLTIGEDEKLQDFKVVKVIDLLSGSNNAASVELPQAFVSHARKKVEGRHFKPTIRDGKPTSTLTCFLYSPAGEKNKRRRVSFSALNRAMNGISHFRLLGQDASLSNFVTDVGRSVFSVSYYAVPLPKERRDQRETIIEAEFQRTAANVPNAEVLSRKNFSTDSQTIMEFTCKSSGNKALTIRCRYICNDRLMLAFTTITFDGLPAGDAQSFDRLFEAFRFRMMPQTTQRN